MAEFSTMLCVEDSRAISADVGDRVDRINSWAQDSIRNAKDVTEAQYENAKTLAARARTAADNVFDDFDVLITPSTRGEAPTDRVNIEPSFFNRIWTLMYVPCLSLPAFSGPNGMPVGLQVVARRGADDRLLAIGRWIEQASAEAGGSLPVASGAPAR